MVDKRCICGRSPRFPLCDGQHTSDGWQCAPDDAIDTCIVAGPHLRSVAERLAHVTRRAAAAHQLEQLPARVRRLWVLTDGSDLEEIQAQAKEVGAQQRRVFIIDAPAAVGVAFPDWPVTVVDPPTPLALWRTLQTAIQHPKAHASNAVTTRVFISHAVVDEARIDPCIKTLRRFGVQAFLCADSIPAGSRWHREIMDALDATQRLIFLASAASRQSTFCAFELGYAQARGIPIRIIALDDALLPPFVQQIQAVEVERLRRRRPWLTADEALLEAFWASLS